MRIYDECQSISGRPAAELLLRDKGLSPGISLGYVHRVLLTSGSLSTPGALPSPSQRGEPRGELWAPGMWELPPSPAPSGFIEPRRVAQAGETLGAG